MSLTTVIYNRSSKHIVEAVTAHWFRPCIITKEYNYISDRFKMHLRLRSSQDQQLLSNVLKNVMSVQGVLVVPSAPSKQGIQLHSL